MFQVVFVLVLLHFHRRRGRRCPARRLRVLWVSLPVVRAAGTVAAQPRRLPAGSVAAGRRVLQAAELGAVTGVHCASAVRLASAHPLCALRAPVRSSLHRGLDPQIALMSEQEQLKRLSVTEKLPM